MSTASFEPSSSAPTASLVSGYVALQAPADQQSSPGILDSNIIILIGTIVLVACSFWLGARSREPVFGACRTTPQSLNFMPEVDSTMTVKAGAACAIWERPLNSFVDSLIIENPPKHGAVRARGLSGVVYRPEPGYAGEDSFSFVRTGSVEYRKGNSLVRVKVSVE